MLPDTPQHGDKGPTMWYLTGKGSFFISKWNHYTGKSDNETGALLIRFLWVEALDLLPVAVAFYSVKEFEGS